MSLKIGDIEFDHLVYDAPVDVLYANVGDPKDAVGWDETTEGDGVSYGPNGGIVGLTILNARLRLEEDGELTFTLPGKRLVTRDLGDALTAAA